MNSVYLLLGANLGDPKTQIKKSLDLIKQYIGSIRKSSKIYQSEAWGLEDQPIFFNQVVEVSTDLSATNVLHEAQQIENILGRVRKKKWGARIIDIDILYYNNTIIKEENLSVPHPLLHLRRFTLVPLVEISPDYIHPVLTKSNQLLLDECSDQLSVSEAAQ